MTLVVLLLAIALPAAAAYAVTGRALRGPPAGLATRALKLGVALPLGLGAASLLGYAWLVAGGTLGRTYAVVDSLGFAALVAALRPWANRRAPRAPAPLWTLDGLACAIAAAALATAAAVFVQGTVVDPLGGWDAWAIWNTHARFLFRGGDGWRALFDGRMAFSHPEYPLLLPTAVARLWAYGGETRAAPALVAGAFALSTALVVFGAVARRAGHVAGATALLLLLATASWVFWGPAQYADVPVACFVAAGAACVFASAPGDEPASLASTALAGALLGLGAWTKDEGFALGVLFAGWALLVAGGGPLRRRALALLAGAAAPLAVRAHFQLALSPGFASLYTSHGGAGTVLGRLLAGDRWAVVASELPGRMPGAERWLPAVAIAAAALLGARWRRLPRSPAIPALAGWAAFALVYGMTPLDPKWQIEASASRVLLQPWPALLLGLFGLVAARQGEGADASRIRRFPKNSA